MSTGPVPAHNVGGDHTPNHMIIWLDKHIGEIENCVLLKKSLIIAMDPNSGRYERSIDRNSLDRAILADTALPVQLDEVEFMFQPCVDVEKCFSIIETNINKRIFLISSGSKGKFLLPIVKAYLSKKFQPGYSIYIFCAKMNMIPTECEGQPTNDWAMDYEDNLLMYNHQNHLLSRLVLDIATHFEMEGRRFEERYQREDARRYYKWSKQMWQRYHKSVARNPMKRKIEEMQNAMDRTEHYPDVRHEGDDNDQIGEPSDSSVELLS